MKVNKAQLAWLQEEYDGLKQQHERMRQQHWMAEGALGILKQMLDVVELDETIVTEDTPAEEPNPDGEATDPNAVPD